MGDISIRGKSPILRQGFAAGGRAGFKAGKRVGHKRNTSRENRLEELGRVDAEKAYTKHGKRNLREEKSRIRRGLKRGGKPWGTGPKPGTHEYMMQDIHKRKGKAIGGTMPGARRAAKTFIERAGGSEKGKPHSTKEGRIASGKRKISRFLQSRALKPKPRPQAPSRPKKTWPPKHSDLLRRYPKMPQPHKSPGDTPYIPSPKYRPGEPKIMQPAAKGGRMGFKKGGSDKKWMQKVSASIKKRGTKGKCTPITKPGCTGRAKALAKTFKKIAAKNKKA